MSEALRELVNVFALTVRFGRSAAELETAAFACPTSASNIASML